MDKEKLERYATLKEDEKRIQAEIKELAPVIVSMIKETGVDDPKVRLKDRGVFILGSKTNYKFSNKVQEMKEDMDKRKKHEVAEGIAEASVTHFLTFSGIKKE